MIMDKSIKKITYILVLIMALVAAGCSDDSPKELKPLSPPTGLTADIVDRTGVCLTWDAANQAYHYHILIEKGETTVKQIDNLTDADIPYTVTGLEGDTDYVAKIMATADGRKDSEYSSISFTTGIDVGDATLVYPEDDFVTMLKDAASGDVFALMPGNYTMSDGTADKFAVKTNVEIKAVRANDRPVIKGYISIESGAALTMKQIVLDGTGTVSYGFVFATAGQTYGALNIQDCEIKNHEVGMFYLDVASLVESIIFNNCLIHGIACKGGDCFSSRSGAYRTLTLSNSTVYNSCAFRDFIRFDSVAAYSGTNPVINITNCTLVGVSAGTNNRLLYVRFTGNSINFNNNLITNTSGIFTNQVATAVPTFSNNNYFSAPGYLAGTTGLFSDSTGTTLDPQFNDAANGDFTVGNATVKDRGIGDPRWLK